MKEILSTLLALAMTALTQNGGEIPAELQAEIDALKAAIDGLSEGEDSPEPGTEATNELFSKISNLASKIKDANVITSGVKKS